MHDLLPCNLPESLLLALGRGWVGTLELRVHLAPELVTDRARGHAVLSRVPWKYLSRSFLAHQAGSRLLVRIHENYHDHIRTLMEALGRYLAVERPLSRYAV